MKTYTFKLIIEEGNDEFWEEIKNKTGCDEVHEAVLVSLCDGGWDPVQLTLQKFEDKSDDEFTKDE